MGFSPIGLQNRKSSQKPYSQLKRNAGRLCILCKYKSPAMPYLKVWIHATWATEGRQPLLTRSIRNTVFEHIRKNGRTKGIFIDRVDGYHDHVHTLFSLSSEMTISKAIQLLKGESSYWINKERIVKEHFGWQSEYYAASVGESELKSVQCYIDGQADHHRTISFDEELKAMIESLSQ